MQRAGGVYTSYKLLGTNASLNRPYPRFCSFPSSLSSAVQKATHGVLGVTQPCRCRCDASLRGGRRAAVPQGAPAATNEPAPRTLLSLGQRSRLAAAVADDAGGRLSHRFQPSPRSDWRLKTSDWRTNNRLPAPGSKPSLPFGGCACCCRLASHRRYHLRAPACCFAG